jgi:1-acyl-sn-glycerol-3-phosphate acyltransferase
LDALELESVASALGMETPPGASTAHLAGLIAAELRRRAGLPEARLLAVTEAPDAAARRSALAARLRDLVDADRTCPHRTLEGFTCGLPAIKGEEQCSLHGGVDSSDLAVPALGRLGTDTWPALLRHLRLASYDIDALGLDPVLAELAWHIGNALYFEYFHVRVEGIEHVPSMGAAVLAANHGGAAIPYDAAMLQLALLNEPAVPRRVRVVGTEVFNMMPFVSHLYRKIGAAYASRQDARWVLGNGQLLGVFPEGVRGFQKPVSESYRLRRFGRGGFASLAAEVGAPVVPVAILGSEETHPALFTSRTLAKAVRTVFPDQRVEEMAVWVNPIPLPVRWMIRFLPPVPTAPGPLDGLAALELAERVRTQIQAALDEMITLRGRAY